jgi:hypothetical protein
MSRTERRWPLALLLAVVLAAFGAAALGGQVRAVAQPHDAAITAYEGNPAALTPARSPGVTEPLAAPAEYATLPSRPVPRARFAHRRALLDHDSVLPRLRRTPSTGDRAPPSH